MKDDRFVRETYIQFVAGPMNDLAKLFVRSETLIRNINVFNKKKNASILQEEYRAFQERVCAAWESIYSNSSQYSESVDQFELLQKGKTIYAITLYQKLVEHFFHCLHLASKMFLSELDENKISRKTDLNPFFSINFSGTDSIMKDIFPLILEEMKKQEFKVDSNIEQAFVEANRIFLKDSLIQYRYGEELTEARIDQIIFDMKEHEKK